MVQKILITLALRTVRSDMLIHGTSC